MWQQEYIPIAGSLALSALAAGAPIFVLLLLLGVLRKPSWMAALAGLATAIVVAIGQIIDHQNSPCLRPHSSLPCLIQPVMIDNQQISVTNTAHYITCSSEIGSPVSNVSGR